MEKRYVTMLFTEAIKSECWWCKGTGKINYGLFGLRQKVCERCKGEGELDDIRHWHKQLQLNLEHPQIKEFVNWVIKAVREEEGRGEEKHLKLVSTED